MRNITKKQTKETGKEELLSSLKEIDDEEELRKS